LVVCAALASGAPSRAAEAELDAFAGPLKSNAAGDTTTSWAI